MGITTNSSNLARQFFGVIFQHHTCANMRARHRELLVERMSGLDDIPNWGMTQSFSYDLIGIGSWELRTAVNRLHDKIDDVSGDKLAEYSPTFTLVSEGSIRAAYGKSCAALLWLGAELDELCTDLNARFAEIRVFDTVATKAELQEAARRAELDRIASKLSAICEPLRKNMRVSGSERAFDRKWFEGVPDGRHEFSVYDGHTKKTYVVRLTTTTARLHRIV